MRAGLLNETISILQLTTTTSPSGAKKKEYQETHKIKAFKRKLMASLGNGVNASEEFIENTIVLQIRKYSFINDKVRIKHKGNTYSIKLIDNGDKNSYIITCRKVND